MKKILIILESLAGGGIEKAFTLISNYLCENNNLEIEILVFETGGIFEAELNKKIIVRRIEGKKIFNKILFMYNEIKKNEYHCIITAMWPYTIYSTVAVKLAKKTNILIINEQVNLEYGLMNIDSYSIQKKYSLKFIKIPIFIIRSILKTMLYISYKCFYFDARLLICSSEGVKQSILKYAAKTYAERINVIHNPVLINSKIETKKIQNSKIKLLNVGRLAEAKNHNLLIDSIHILNKKKLPVELTVVGEGPLRQILENKIKELNLTNNVKLVGFKTNLEYYYENSHIFVLSSRVEGFANVLVEALSYGLSVVSTDCPSGPSEVLCNGLYGTLVKEQSALSLANAIENQYNNLADINHQKSRALDFEISVIANKYEQIIKKIQN